MGDKADLVMAGVHAAEESPFPLTDLDRKVLSQTDEEYVKHDWEDLKRTIGGPYISSVFLPADKSQMPTNWMHLSVCHPTSAAT